MGRMSRVSNRPTIAPAPPPPIGPHKAHQTTIQSNDDNIMERTSFVFYASWWEAIKNLPRAMQGDVLTAIIEYGLTGATTAPLKPIAKAMLTMVRTQIDANRQKYENGRRGGRPMRGDAADGTGGTETEAGEGTQPEPCMKTETKTKPKPNPNQTETKPDKSETKAKPNPNQALTKAEPNPYNNNENEYEYENEDVNENEDEKGREGTPPDGGSRKPPRPEGAPASLPREPGAPPAKTGTAVDYEGIVRAWNVAAMGRLPVVSVMSEARRAALRARCAEHGEEAVLEVIRRACRSRFLCGGNDRDWRADFDWVMRPRNFVKIMEGNYDETSHNATHYAAAPDARRAPAGSLKDLAEQVLRGTTGTGH